MYGIIIIASVRRVHYPPAAIYVAMPSVRPHWRHRLYRRSNSSSRLQQLLNSHYHLSRRARKRITQACLQKKTATTGSKYSQLRPNAPTTTEETGLPRVADLAATPASPACPPLCASYSPGISGSGVFNTLYSMCSSQTLPWDAQVKGGLLSLHTVYRFTPSIPAAAGLKRSSNAGVYSSLVLR